MTPLQDSGEEKSSQLIELQAVHLVVHFAWKEKWPDVCILIYVPEGLARQSETLLEQITKLIQENLRQGHGD